MVMFVPRHIAYLPGRSEAADLVGRFEQRDLGTRVGQTQGECHAEKSGPNNCYLLRHKARSMGGCGAVGSSIEQLCDCPIGYLIFQATITGGLEHRRITFREPMKKQTAFTNGPDGTRR